MGLNNPIFSELSKCK